MKEVGEEASRADAAWVASMEGSDTAARQEDEEANQLVQVAVGPWQQGDADSAEEVAYHHGA